MAVPITKPSTTLTPAKVARLNKAAGIGPKKKKVVVKRPPVRGTVSQDDILRIARARSQETFAAARAPIVNFGAAQGQQQLGASQGLAKVLADVSQRIQDIYGGASKETAALGQGYSAQLGDTLRTADADTQARLAQMGLPGAGGPDAAGAAQDVAYGLGGAMPASNLLKQGAGYASAAAFLPATTLQQGLAQKGTTDRATQQQLAELAAKYPEVFASNIEAERNWKNAQFDNYTNYLNSQGGGGGSMAKPKISIRPDGTIVSIDPYTGVPTVTGQTTPTSTTPRTGPGSKAGKARTDALKKRDDTVTTVSFAQTKWLDGAIAKSKVPVKVGVRKDPFSGASVPIYKKPPATTYRYAFNYMFNQMWLSLKRFGYKKSDIRQMVAQILEAHNLHPELKGPPNPNGPADRPVG